jgi:hypothetical protein
VILITLVTVAAPGIDFVPGTFKTVGKQEVFEIDCGAECIAMRAALAAVS